MTIRFVTVSIQDDKGQPVVSFGAKVTIRRQPYEGTYYAEGNEQWGSGNNENTALSDWIRTVVDSRLDLK